MVGSLKLWMSLLPKWSLGTAESLACVVSLRLRRNLVERGRLSAFWNISVSPGEKSLPSQERVEREVETWTVQLEGSRG